MNVSKTGQNQSDFQLTERISAPRRSVLRSFLKILGSTAIAISLAFGVSGNADAARKRSNSRSGKTIVIQKNTKKNKRLNKKGQGQQRSIIDEIKDASNRGTLGVLVNRASAQGLINNNFMTAMHRCLNAGNTRNRHNCAYVLSLTVEPRFAAIITPRVSFELTHSDEPEVRTLCAKALGRLGPAGNAKAASALAEALEDRGAPTRREAATALGKLRAVKYGKKVLAVAQNEEEIRETRQAAILALGEMNYKKAVADLNDIAKDGSEIMRVTAARALCQMEHPSGRSFAEKMTKSADEYQRKDATWLLGGINKAWAKDMLAQLLQDSSVNVQIAAAKALAEIKDNRGSRWLVLRAQAALDSSDFELSNRLEQAIEDVKISPEMRKSILKKKR